MESRSRSLWIDTQPGETFPVLARDLDVDVAIVGGGLTGLTAAMLLKRAGRSVAVLEAQRIGEGVSGFTTAHVSEVPDATWQRIVGAFGEDGARLAAHSQRAAIERIAAFVREESITCDFGRVPGYLFAEPGQDVEAVEREARAARQAGLAPVLTRDVPLPFSVGAAARFDDQARFHPRAYLLGIAGALVSPEHAIFEQTRVSDVEDGEPCRVVTDRGVVRARDVIVATHVPVNNKLFLQTKIAAYRSYVVTARVRGALADALFWDVAEPYHYLRRHASGNGVADGETLIVGGEDHRVGQEDDTELRYARLEEYVRARYREPTFVGRWSAQVLEPADGLPYVGRNSAADHVWVATGFSGNGIAFGTMAALLLSDLVLERTNPWAGLYQATRIKPLASLRAFVTENVAYPVHLVGDRLRRPEPATLASIPHGHGRIVEVDGERLAVYRDEDGRFWALAPHCTHLGCQVAWNTAERTWDCPCHGSRFEPTGEVIDGPAVQALARRILPGAAEPAGEPAPSA